MIPRLLLVTLCLSGLAIAPQAARADLVVVTTVPDLAALARDIGGSHARVRALSLHTQDPHWVDAKPSLALAVNQADLLIAVGLSLEVGWLPVLQTGARNAAIQTGGKGYLECSQFVRLLGVAKTRIDRSMGDIHPGGNPHYLYDPRAAADCARGIAATMAALDPDNAGAYRTNLAGFSKKLDQRRKAWEKRLAGLRGTAIVTYHKSFTYLSNWLGLVEVAHLQPKPGIRPSPRHVARVIAVGKKRGVKILLQEGFYPDKTGKLVSRKIGARMLSLPSATNFRAGQSYIDHMDALVETLATAMEG